mgnify:CR=1 FL=1
MGKVQNTFSIMSDGDYSEYCSLIEDDGIAKVIVEIDMDKVSETLEKLKGASQELGFEVFTHVDGAVDYQFLDEHGGACEAEFMRLEDATLDCRGCIRLNFESAHTSEDFWRKTLYPGDLSR